MARVNMAWMTTEYYREKSLGQQWGGITRTYITHFIRPLGPIATILPMANISGCHMRQILTPLPPNDHNIEHITHLPENALKTY